MKTSEKMLLFLDTSGFDKVHFALIDKTGKISKKTFSIKHNDSAKILSLLKKFLLQQKAVGNISKIIVVSGPGSFSGIRVGVSIALAFSLVWEVSAFALKGSDVPKNLKLFAVPAPSLKSKIKKITADFDPDYGAAPKITKEKPKKLRNT